MSLISKNNRNGKILIGQWPRGFTLIEIVIVLAIAGLIMVIVFLAVQGAQVSRRDTERKAAVARALTSISQYAANNKGLTPANCNAFSTYYTSGGYECSNLSAAAENTTPANNRSVFYSSVAKCNTAQLMTSSGAHAKQSAVSIVLEAGSALYCQND